MLDGGGRQFLISSLHFTMLHFTLLCYSVCVFGRQNISWTVWTNDNDYTQRTETAMSNERYILHQKEIVQLAYVSTSITFFLV